MITVKELKLELEKFPDDALCYAYEGEAIGIVINDIGFIHCGDTDEKEGTTELYN